MKTPIQLIMSINDSFKNMFKSPRQKYIDKFPKNYKWKEPKDEKSFAESLHDLNPNNLFKNKAMYGMDFGHGDCRCVISSWKPYDPAKHDIIWIDEAQEIKEKDFLRLLREENMKIPIENPIWEEIKKKESNMKKTKKVIFKALGCRICGEQAVVKTVTLPDGQYRGVMLKNLHECPNDPNHNLILYSLPFEMKLKKEIKLPEVGSIIELYIPSKNKLYYGRVMGHNRDHFDFNNGDRTFAVFYDSGFTFKYLKEA